MKLERWRARIAVLNGVVLVAAVLSVSQVHYNLADGSAGSAELTLPSPSESASVAAGSASPSASGSASPSASASLAPTASAVGTSGAAGGTSVDPASIPHFGLVTQGVTSKTVTIGASYNISGCGDAGSLSASVSKGTVGDPEKAYDAFIRYINDTGGIGGLTLKLVTADDGAGGCPEKEQSAAVKLVDDDKVFAVIPGINPVGDYAAKKKIPVFGGRDDPQSIAKLAPNELGLLAPLDPTFEAWASFGRYYLGSRDEKACLLHADDPDWNSYEKLIVAKVKKYGFAFTDVIRYSTSLASALSQANAAVTRMRADGCREVWYMDWNGVANVFITAAAAQNNFHPRVWTFTSYTALMDYELSGSLMNQDEWSHAVGLSARVPDGQHPAQGQCAQIYDHYYGGDGNSDSAAVTLACGQILTSSEFMRRGIKKYGVLNADTLLLGAGMVKNDFYFDAHVPLRFTISNPRGPFDTKGQHDFTIVKWNSDKGAYEFPTYPKYWESFGPNLSGSKDLRKLWSSWKRLPMPR